jgi:apolipoprotein N-acyltransferase
VRWVELWWRLPLAVLGGLLALYTFPTENIWVLAPLIPALILIATLGMGFWPAYLVGFIASQAFYIAHIEWISLYLGPVPLLALSTLMSIYFGLGVAITALVWRKLKTKPQGYFAFAFIAAAIWTSREWLATNFPYGGFPWSRLGMTQAHGPLANWSYWGGISLLSFAVALAGSLLAMLYVGRKAKSLSRMPYAIAAAVIALVPVLTPVGIFNPQVGESVVAAVQGNAKAGLFANQTPGTILQNHLDASELIFSSPLADEVDLVVWPENASDLDPLRRAEARTKIEAFSSRVGASFTFGTITERGEESFNTTLLWEPGVGPVDYYDKQRPVPFAEYVPDRAFWRMFAPQLIDLVPRGFSFGVRDGIFDTAGFPSGSLICFEIAVDDIPRGLANQGAQLILSQTNNADFGYSDETFQQSAIAKLRAIETGRTVVNISTVGLSAIFLPNGQTLAELEWYKPGAMVEKVPLYSGFTPALWLAGWTDLVIALLGAVLIGIRWSRR